MSIKGENERCLYEALNEAYPGKWVSEHKGITGRKFRFDCANPSEKVAIEIEGGIWMGKGHTGGLHYQQDMEKYNLAVLEGWKVLRYTTDTVRKTPWKIIADVRKLCGVQDGNQTMLDLSGLKQTTLHQIQVKLL